MDSKTVRRQSFTVKEFDTEAYIDRKQINNSVVFLLIVLASYLSISAYLRGNKKLIWLSPLILLGLTNAFIVSINPFEDDSRSNLIKALNPKKPKRPANTRFSTNA